ncbi:MAG: triose-phosphate isomerase [Oligoflexia bacterium]|nr:triose-phosphate isomerase [Oligoflexia bacterium]
MNQTQEEIRAFFATFKNLVSGITTTNHETWIAPQFVHIPLVHSLFFPNGQVGAQNCSHKEKGAFTGDVSAKALKDIDAHFVIIGHSERRAIFKEDPLLLREKIQVALANKLKIIFCIGETLKERENGDALRIVGEQLNISLNGVASSSEIETEILLAYEPVWAIGTGRTATPEQAQEMHAYIRKLLQEQLKLNSALLPILYGGSVTPENIDALLQQPDINGALVGGASLKANDFAKLFASAAAVQQPHSGGKRINN